VSDPVTGKGLDRVDGRLKVTGRAGYSADIPVANVAHAVIVGSTISKGRVAAIETRKAEQAPGVLAVLTHLNAPRLPGASQAPEPNARVVQLLQDERVAYDGQPIALVVAETFEAARFAATLIDVRYETEEPAVDIEANAGKAVPAKPAANRGPSASSRGDFDKAFAGAPVKIDQTYTTPIQNHNPMETHGTIAVWQGDDRLTLYDATQGIFGVQRRLAQLLGLPRENVRVISHFLGGAFGCKGSPWSHVALAAMGARVAKRAVKLVVTRQQMFQFVGYRPRTIQRVSLGARPDGSLLALRHDLLSETSRFEDYTEPSAYASRMLYGCANARTSHQVVHLDLSTPTFMRAPGESSGSFALECAMDELAHALEMDPLALRLKNYAETDLDLNRPYSSKSLRECYRQAAEKFGWAKRSRKPMSMKDGNLLVGWGMATASYPARQMPSSAEARVRADGTALVVAGSQDLGTGTYTVMTQLAADWLAMPFEKVQFDLGDTVLPEAPLSSGSSTVSSVGSAVKMAALAVRTRLTELAMNDPKSPLHGVAPNDIEAKDGALVWAGKRDPYTDILARSGLKDVVARVDNKEKEDRKRYSTHSFGAQLVEVKIDPDLGVVRVTRAVGAFAAGKIVNAKTARSQLMGGMVWGIGYALQERTVRDARDARLVTKDLADYHVPVNADVPPIEVIMVDEVDPHVNEIGAKGIGELGLVGAAAAIANAVYHATGKRVRDLPISLDKLVP
jgi:xanthine dehydrogenase YagR molybdenum-binding subunit